MKNQQIEQQIKWNLEDEELKNVYAKSIIMLHLAYFGGILYLLFF